MGKTKKDDRDEIVDVSATEQFIEKNFPKIIFGVVGLIALAAIAIFLFQGGKKKETKAETAAIQAQEAFGNDNWALAIEGDDSQLGFQAIADQHAGTRIGNLAHYYLGISYMKQSNFEKAVEELSKFKLTKDPNINGLAQMNLGDALSELDRKAEALTHYKKASNESSEIYQADFIFRYALAQISAGDFTGAKKSLETIKEKFPNNALATQADNYLAGL